MSGKSQNKQYVCLVCGFNMVGDHPDKCPFCNAPKEKFLTSEECSKRFKVESFSVNKNVTRLNSTPTLGLEHSAYRIETDNKTYWIDCPSSFDNRLKPMDIIIFTHHHFLGASNLYREYFSSSVRIHTLDSVHDICQAFTFDETFQEDFIEDGIDAFHIAGHTPGFTFYIFEDILFVCDYVFIKDGKMTYNPYGPKEDTWEGGRKLKNIIEKRNISINIVCGYNYVIDYSDWRGMFDNLCV
jgi:hydroxyacylglutathione hydrolase